MPRELRSLSKASSVLGVGGVIIDTLHMIYLK